MLKNPIICAIDTTDIDEASALATQLKDVVGGIKLGLEFFIANGPDGVKQVTGYGTSNQIPLFLDLKLHDIPKTVAGAMKSVVHLGAFMTTVHTLAGEDVLSAAVDAARSESLKYGKERPLVMGVTILTSMDDDDLSQIGLPTVATQVPRLASLSSQAGLDGCICSSHEIGRIRDDFGSRLKLAVPGIRPHGGETNDQKRIMTASAALNQGADFLVIGRPITQSKDPVAAARLVLQDIERGAAA